MKHNFDIKEKVQLDVYIIAHYGDQFSFPCYLYIFS